MLKKIITFTLIAVLMVSSTFTFAANTQSQTTGWKDSLDKLISLAVVDQADINAGGKMTRAVFSKIIVNSTGNYDLAKSLSGSTTFSDVSAKSAYCGFINAAAKLGYLSAYSDGKFRPDNAVTFAQLCVAMVNALGYTSSDIVGAWPTGYINKANSLGITTGFTFGSNSDVSTDAAVIMIERMLNTDIKKINAQDADMTLAEASGLTNDQNNMVYGKPEVALNFDYTTKKLGNITFKAGIPILKDTTDNTVTPATKVSGETIALKDINEKDVVYEVYNKLNELVYYLVVDNKITGQVTSILPDKYSPKQVQINDINYDLGQYAKLNKFNTDKKSFNVDDDITVVLGYDGKIVDAFGPEGLIPEDFAFVVDSYSETSKDAADFGKTIYKVDLLLVNGTTKTYKTVNSQDSLKWLLVKYRLTDEETVVLEKQEYIKKPAETQIDKYEKKVGQNYISSGIRIFNYTDSKVSLLDWADVPNGTLPAGVVQYIGTAGDFGDVNLLVTNDLLNEQKKDYVIKRISAANAGHNLTYTFTLVSGTEEITYTSKADVSEAIVGSVLNMTLSSNGSMTFNKLKKPDGEGKYVQALDSKRIKTNDMVYVFSQEVAFYVKDKSFNLTTVDQDDIDVGNVNSYKSVKVYCDRPGGKVVAVVLGL